MDNTRAQSKLIECNENEKQVKPQKISKFRRFLPQVRVFSLCICEIFTPFQLFSNFFLFPTMATVDFGCDRTKPDNYEHNDICSISVNCGAIAAWIEQ